jgi:uncharacterized protein (DUF1501 family)
VSHDDHCCPPSPADIRLKNAAMEGCAESKLLMSRRAMLGVTAGLFSWAYMPRFAEGATNDPRLLVVVLRGGMDGINVCVPYGDPHYASMRGDIAIPKSSTIQLNADFGLHPALPKFGAMFRNDEAAVVHAACVPLRNRSHFDCQDNLENGLPGANAANPTGWLNRLLTALPAGAPVKKAGAIEIGEAPLILRGPAPVLGWSPTWFDKVDDPLLYMVRTLYREKDREMYDVLQRGLEADRIASKVDRDDGDISDLRKAFRGAARLIAANDGPRIAVLSVGGWDTHSDQGAAQGQLAGVLGELDLAIADFKTTMGATWSNTAVVCATEFGRTVHVNGDSGTDHGVGTVVLMAGGAIRGGKVFGDWPGIAQNQLYEDSDLRPTTDVRSIFKGILRDHIGVPTNLLNQQIFPSSATAAPIMGGLIKSSPAPMTSAGPEVARVRQDTPIARYRRSLKGQQQASLR